MKPQGPPPTAAIQALRHLYCGQIYRNLVAANGMYNRHNEVPVFEHRDTEIAAEHYNLVQTALRRLQPQLRLQLPQLRTLEFILQEDAWIVVDRAFNDIPIAAWTEFELQARSALHTPILCQLRLFHANGGVVARQVLETMHQLLRDALDVPSSAATVLPFPGEPRKE